MTINIAQRTGSEEELIERLIDRTKSEIRVALPAKVTSFDPQRQTISCIPTVRELVAIDGEISFVTFPELQDVPILIPRGGNFAITLPIKVDDECMVVFQDLCLDSWWYRGGIQNWNDLRRHDLSDAVAIFSPWSQPNVLSEYNQEALEVRSLDGNTLVRISDDKVELIRNDKCIKITDLSIEATDQNNSVSLSEIGINAFSTVKIALQAPVVTINGKNFDTHAHSGVQGGNSNTGPVVS